MAGITLATIRTRIRQRADMENTQFVTDAELNQLINTEYQEMYGMLVRHSLQRSELVETVTADGSASYALPDDFYSLIGVFRVEGDVRYRLMRHGERHRSGTVTGPGSTYRMLGAYIEFYPRPATGTYELVYIPVPADLASDADLLDGVLGWEELVVLSAAIKCLHKEESETDHLERQKQALLKRIQDEAAAVEFTENWTVEPVRRGRYRDSAMLEGAYLDRRGLRNWRW